MAINQAQTNKTEITMAFGWRKKWILYVNYSTKYFILTPSESERTFCAKTKMLKHAQFYEYLLVV